MKLKVYKFYADWCGPCKVLKTTLSGFDACELQEVNVDKEAELTDKYGVRALPTIVLVNEQGDELWRKSGIMTKAELDSVVQKHK